MRWYKHYLADYAQDTGDLSIAEHGAYRLLLDHYYISEGELPTTPEALQHLCRAATKPERAAVDTVAQRFFPINGTGTRHNARADIEIARWQAQANLNRELGKKGGRPRKTESVSEPKPNRKPNRIVDPLFDQFWQLYPRRVAKPAALRAWARLRATPELLAEIRDDLLGRQRSPEWNKDGGAFIPHPATYLNNRRWDDCLTDVKGT